MYKKREKHENSLLCNCTCGHSRISFSNIRRLNGVSAFILFGLVMALELVNTAVESVVDLVTKERQPLAKIAKDTAAGAVLIAAIMAAIAGLIIFVPKLLQIIGY